MTEFLISGWVISWIVTECRVFMTCLLHWFFIGLLHAAGEIHRRSVCFLQNKHTPGERRWSYSASAGGRRYYCTWFCPDALDGFLPDCVWSTAGLLALCHKHRSNTWSERLTQVYALRPVKYNIWNITKNCGIYALYLSGEQITLNANSHQEQ